MKITREERKEYELLPLLGRKVEGAVPVSPFKVQFFDKTLTCSICKRECFTSLPYCESCLKSLPYNDGDRCPACGRHVPYKNARCERCSVTLNSFDRAFSVFDYLPPITSYIARMKYFDKSYIAEEIAYTFLFSAYKAMDFNADLVVCPPMSEKEFKQRGYNQSQLLAAKTCECIGVPFKGELIKKIKETSRQATLTSEERVKNIKGAFKITDKSAFKNKKVLIIDDVMTTGATLNEISEVIRECKPKLIYCLTVASVPEKDSFFVPQKNSFLSSIKDFFKRK